MFWKWVEFCIQKYSSKDAISLWIVGHILSFVAPAPEAAGNQAALNPASSSKTGVPQFQYLKFD